PLRSTPVTWGEQRPLPTETRARTMVRERDGDITVLLAPDRHARAHACRKRRMPDPRAPSGSFGVPLSEEQLSPLDDFWVVPVHGRPVARNDLRPTAIASDEVDPVLVARRHVDDDLGTVTSDGR